MIISEISLPEIYKSSQDFRFFLRWFTYIFEKIQYDIENMADLYDPLRCPDWLLWLLGDTVGYKYDDRLPTAFNRLVLVYFMSMIRNKGSKDGVTLAAEVNLAQFNILEYGKEKEILYNRLEDTAIPVNSVSVTPHTDKGYIDVVYFSDKTPIDACIEYVRPVGMYIFENSGVRMDARSRLMIDARLCDEREVGMSIGPTHVGHYSRADYASMQKHTEDAHGSSHTRRDVWYRNSDYEQGGEDRTPKGIDPGYRTLYSLQLCNNDHIMKSILPRQSDNDKIFGLGYEPQDVSVYYPDGYVLPDVEELPTSVLPGKQGPLDVDGNTRVPNAYNLRYDKDHENSIDGYTDHDVYTIDDDRSSDIVNPRPAVNPVMAKMGDAVSINDTNSQYGIMNNQGVIEKKNAKDIKKED